MANLNTEDRKDVEDFEKEFTNLTDSDKIQLKIATALMILANKFGRKLR